MLTTVLAFAAAAVVLVVAATVLTRAADEIADRTGLGQVVVGMLFVALATSVPELVTNLTAVLGGAADLAVADLLGANMANMASLAVVDLMARRAVWPRVDLGHLRLAAVAIGLTAVAVAGLVADDVPSFGWVGVDTLLIVALYVSAVVWIQRAGIQHPVEPGTQALREPTSGEAPGGSIRGPLARFAGAAALVAVSAPVLAIAGEDLAVESGLGEAFVGAAFVAVATALPELATAVAAVRIGAANLAVGNLLGSNALNMALLFILDVAHTEGPILRQVAGHQAVAAGCGILLMALAQAGIAHGQETRIRRLEPDAVLMLTMYGLSLALLASTVTG